LKGALLIVLEVERRKAKAMVDPIQQVNPTYGFTPVMNATIC